MYPAPFSAGTQGEGQWYCAWHFGCHDRAYGDLVVEQSHEWDGTPDSYLKLRMARHARAVEAGKTVAEPGDPG